MEADMQHVQPRVQLYPSWGISHGRGTNTSHHLLYWGCRVSSKKLSVGRPTRIFLAKTLINHAFERLCSNYPILQKRNSQLSLSIVIPLNYLPSR